MLAMFMLFLCASRLCSGWGKEDWIFGLLGATLFWMIAGVLYVKKMRKSKRRQQQQQQQQHQQQQQASSSSLSLQQYTVSNVYDAILALLVGHMHVHSMATWVGNLFGRMPHSHDYHYMFSTMSTPHGMAGWDTLVRDCDHVCNSPHSGCTHGYMEPPWFAIMNQNNNKKAWCRSTCAIEWPRPPSSCRCTMLHTYTKIGRNKLSQHNVSHLFRKICCYAKLVKPWDERLDVGFVCEAIIGNISKQFNVLLDRFCLVHSCCFNPTSVTYICVCWLYIKDMTLASLSTAIAITIIFN